MLQTDKSLGQTLRLKAEEAKMALSQAPSWNGMVGNICHIDRNTFEQLALTLVNDTVALCRKALEDAKLKIEDIDEVVLVGGSTRVPMVKQAVAGFFGRTPHDDLNPDEVVALGAAVQRHLSRKQQRPVVARCNPSIVGIETMGGLMDVIIPRNSKVPMQALWQYTTQLDGQINMRISVFQGERDLVQDNRRLGEFTLAGIPARAVRRIAKGCHYLYHRCRRHFASPAAKELRLGVAQSIQVKPQYGLTEEEYGTNAIRFHQKRKNTTNKSAARLEAVNEAENILAATQRFIAKNSEHLDPIEITETEKLIVNLKEVLNTSTIKTLSTNTSKP